MFGYILLFDDASQAENVSREIYVEDCLANGNQPGPPPAKMFGVCENILSGEVGLHVPPKYWLTLPERFKIANVHKTPLWIDQSFITGQPMFFIGSGPFGFGVGFNDPTQTRKILEGNFAKPLLDEVRNSTRKYTVEVQERAERFILDAADSSMQESLLATVDPILFEEVVAELLSSKGFDVFLTSRTRDRGKDIYAAWPTQNGPLLMMVECKRRNPDSAIDAISIRALLGQFTYERSHGSVVNCAMLATTARRRGIVACDFSEKVTDLSVKTFEDLSAWIMTYGKSRSGLWVPNRMKDVL